MLAIWNESDSLIASRFISALETDIILTNTSGSDISVKLGLKDGNTSEPNYDNVRYTLRKYVTKFKEYTLEQDVTIPNHYGGDLEGTACNATSGAAISIIDVTESGTLAKLQVGVIIKHNCPADLDIYLKHENTCVELSTDNGSCHGDYGEPDYTLGWGAAVVFDDNAYNELPLDLPIWPGKYKPEGKLSDFYDLNIQGTWALYVFDDYTISNSSGTLRWWGLRLYYQ